ncbi:MAG: restriction endonuclease [Planctomycetes bacterium]|nr:restriction endonuclease [Planctomycetota bacterium]
MPEITRQRTGELTRGVFNILKDHPDGLPAREVLRRLEQIVPPTEFEQSTYPNHPDVRRYEKIVRFQTIGPVKAGWLVKERGQWRLTPEGKAAYERHKDPEELMKEAGRLYRRWKSEQPAELPAESVGAEETSEETSIVTLEEAEESSWAEIARYLAQMNPFELQALIAGLLVAMGYHVVWTSPPGPDKGLDIIAHTDPLGIQGPRIKVQVKRRADRIEVDGLRSFLALLSDGDVGIFVSTGGFTGKALEEARSQERRRVMLIDAERLFDLWVEHYPRIPEDKRRLLPLKPVHYLDLEKPGT